RRTHQEVRARILGFGFPGRQGFFQEDDRQRHDAGRHLRGDELRTAQAHLPSAGRLHQAGSVLRGADQGLSRRNEAGMTHGQGSPSAGAPPLLRPLLDGIDRLSRLDGWLGAGCLVTLTALMLAEVVLRALSNVFPWVPADIPVAWEYSSYL